MTPVSTHVVTNSPHAGGGPEGAWRAFSFESGHFLLHIPSSHVLEVTEPLARHVRGEHLLDDGNAALSALAGELAQPAKRDVQTDIRAISLNMAQGCNLRCVYCFAGDGDYGKKAMMTLETAVNVVKFFTANKDWFHITFFGGEPLLNFTVIKQLVLFCETLPVSFSYAITTNGTLLNAEKLAWLKEKNVAVTISYDGHGLQARQRLSQDKRGNSEALVEKKLKAFEQELGSLRSLLLRSTVTRVHLDLLEESILSTITSHNYRLAVYHHATAIKSQQFTDADVKQLGQIYERVIDRLVSAGDFQRLLRLENVKKHLTNIKEGKTAGKACGAGVNYLTVSASGSFHLCHRFNEDESEAFGSVEAGLDENRLREVAKFRGADQEPCRSCWMRQWCAGGCMHENKAATGNTFAVDPVYCKLQEIEITQAMRVYTILKDQAPHFL